MYLSIKNTWCPNVIKSSIVRKWEMKKIFINIRTMNRILIASVFNCINQKCIGSLLFGQIVERNNIQCLKHDNHKWNMKSVLEYRWKACGMAGNAPDLDERERAGCCTVRISQHWWLVTDDWIQIRYCNESGDIQYQCSGEKVSLF